MDKRLRFLKAIPDDLAGSSKTMKKRDEWMDRENRYKRCPAFFLLSH